MSSNRDSLSMQIVTPCSRVVAVLGPTNTGKTHYAMERMLGHASGMIGFPLRLLARENYDRAKRLKGASAVALITGEEKIVPLGARYFLCTVESMPIDRRVAFVGIDEVQMCADPDRGHVFTERLLNTRGEEETMLMGADTMRPLIRQLVPEAEFMSRPRYSTLAHTGQHRTSRLPKRSAAVAFSAADVYAIAEQFRRQRGGAAVVLGALSPRTRNAQVGMYQQGEVDYLVATDAIGMGLNMDVNHVAFAATHKFDGRVVRDLTPPELAQIAGRAGRYMNNGTFGTTAGATLLSAEVAARIENHEFDPLKKIFWRNPQLRFASVADLQSSLTLKPERAGLSHARKADDELALEQMTRDADVMALATGGEAVHRLWEVCQIPDFRKVMSDAHARLLGIIYRQLMGPGSRLPTDWFANQVARLDRTDGDIETLTQRLAGVRIWTYISFRAEWLGDAGHWQESTRCIEDKLSDALHERLTQRFVDRRTALLVSRIKEREKLLAAVTDDGVVIVEGHSVGRLEGFRFIPEPDPHGLGETVATRAVTAAAGKALRGEIGARVIRFMAEPETAFTLIEDAEGVLSHDILWRGVSVAYLDRGPALMKPAIRPFDNQLIQPADRDRIEKRLRSWLDNLIAAQFTPLNKVEAATGSGLAKGIAFRLAECLGSFPRRNAAQDIAVLSKTDRQALRRAGVRFGRESVYVPALLKPAAVRFRRLLWCLYNKTGSGLPMPPPGRVSVAGADQVTDAYWEAIGYRAMGLRAVRIDIVERIAGRAWALARTGPFAAGAELLTIAGCGADEMAEILNRLGYRQETRGGKVRYRLKLRSRRKFTKLPPRQPAAPAEGSPFEKLRDFVVER
ncbi:MAG: hypothetical protein CFH05_01131 [Alphaproteobacteria bacterium MarineAlpha3_Bin4]|nr:MAG: hypothetical protein CFH05_01131 [Alphaproteobacteria bacterium MarineAlpha3_Bin4]